MRSGTEILSIVSDAKINYSYRIQKYELEKQRGIQSEFWDTMFMAINCIKAIEYGTLSINDQSKLCDRLISENFILLQDNNMFSELVFNDNTFDTL